MSRNLEVIRAGLNAANRHYEEAEKYRKSRNVFYRVAFAYHMRAYRHYMGIAMNTPSLLDGDIA